MSLPVPIELTLTCLREAFRSLVMPLHLLAYLPRQRYWRAESLRALETPPEESGQKNLERFIAAMAPPSQATGSTREPNKPRHIFISAGEASGEAHAYHLMRAVKKAGAEPRWTCFGGSRMQEAGGDLLFGLSEYAIMGIAGVFKALPILLRAYAAYLRLLDRDRPDLVVLVDYPGLHVVMAAAAKKRGIPVLHYIAPQYWAWAPWRMNRYRKSVDATLTILPFEPAFFARAGIFSAYVGHPLLDAQEASPPDPWVTAEAQKQRTLCLMPGSRRKEIDLQLPGMLRVARKLRSIDPELRVVLAHRDERRAALINEHLQREQASFVEFKLGEIGPWLKGARAVLVKSGTGSLEACLHGTPSVVVYRVKGRISSLFLDNLLNVPFFASANLIAGRQVVPEIPVKHEFEWETRVFSKLEALWQDGETRDTCSRDLEEVRSRLGSAGASARAAAWVLPFCSPPLPLSPRPERTAPNDA